MTPTPPHPPHPHLRRPGRRYGPGRLLAAALAVVLAVGGVLLAGAPAADAHPLGNATVNHYDGLTLFADHVTDDAVEDTAEIPTLQRTSLIDTNGDGALSPGERGAYAAAQCAGLAAAATLTAEGARLPVVVTTSSYQELPGAIGLKVGRLDCALRAEADLTRPAQVGIDDGWDSAGIGGWHEITATGQGVTLHNSPVPATSISNQLRQYPNDLLSSPLDVRAATLATTPGPGASTYAAAQRIPGAGIVLRALNGLATTFNNLVGTEHLSVGVGLLAVLLAILLGAGHAFLPGHGKTIMAAYLVGRRGRLRDVITVGATVTLTHTLGVLALGLLLSLSAAFAPTAVEQALAVVSGLIVAGVGVGLLVSALRRRHTNHPTHPTHTTAVRTGLTSAGPDRTDLAMLAAQGATPPDTTHLHGHTGPPDHSGAHDQVAVREHVSAAASPPAQSPPAPSPPRGLEHAAPDAVVDDPAPHQRPDDHGHGHGHGHGDGGGFSRGGLIGLGVAGGLVPSPSALLVLLAAIALGRTSFGIVLVLGYGLGMAAALSAAGLLLVRLRGRLGRLLTHPRFGRASRLLALLPVFTACLVVLVGVGLVLRALTGSV